MRILLCHNNFRITGGADLFYHEVAKILAAHGHEVALFSCFEDGIDSTWVSYFPKNVDYSRDVMSSILHFNRLIYSRDAKRYIKNLVRDFKPDIAHCFAISTRLTPSILDGLHESGVPIVMSLNDYKHICPNYKLFHHGHLCEDCKNSSFYHAIMNRCSHNSLIYSTASALEACVHDFKNIYRRNVKTFLFASNFMACKTEEFWGNESFRWRLLRNPFDGRQFKLNEEYENYLLFFGRLIDEKGIDVLIHAMLHVPEAYLKIIGEGPQERILRDLCERLGLQNVEFLGPKWGTEMNLFLAKARFTVVPSLWHENLPYVILQSFAMGKTVIGSNRGGIPELIEHGVRGLTYEATDIKALADSIRQLWNHPHYAVEMGKAAKKYVDAEFNDEKFYGSLMAIYSEVLQ